MIGWGACQWVAKTETRLTARWVLELQIKKSWLASAGKNKRLLICRYCTTRFPRIYPAFCCCVLFRLIPKDDDFCTTLKMRQKKKRKKKKELSWEDILFWPARISWHISAKVHCKKQPRHKTHYTAENLVQWAVKSGKKKRKKKRVKKQEELNYSVVGDLGLCLFLMTKGV